MSDGELRKLELRFMALFRDHPVLTAGEAVPLMYPGVVAGRPSFDSLKQRLYLVALGLAGRGALDSDDSLFWIPADNPRNSIIEN